MKSNCAHIFAGLPLTNVYHRQPFFPRMAPKVVPPRPKVCPKSPSDPSPWAKINKPPEPCAAAFLITYLAAVLPDLFAVFPHIHLVIFHAQVGTSSSSSRPADDVDHAYNQAWKTMRLLLTNHGNGFFQRLDLC